MTGDTGQEIKHPQHEFDPKTGEYLGGIADINTNGYVPVVAKNPNAHTALADIDTHKLPVVKTARDLAEALKKDAGATRPEVKAVPRAKPTWVPPRLEPIE